MKHEPLFQVLTEIVEVICRRHLEDLRIFTEDIDGVTTLVVMPHAADYPRLVGKHGGCVHAMENLVQRASVRLGERIRYSLRESFKGDREPVEDFAFNPAFDVPAFDRRLNDLAFSVSGRSWNFKISPERDTLVVTCPCDRSDGTETFLAVIEAVLKPACYGNGRKLRIKPEFTN